MLCLLPLLGSAEPAAFDEENEERGREMNFTWQRRCSIMHRFRNAVFLCFSYRRVRDAHHTLRARKQEKELQR